MTDEEFNTMEVKAVDRGYYFVTLHQYKKDKPDHPDYIQDWLEFDGENWDYFAGYKNTCYVCFIHRKDLESLPIN